MIRTTYSIAFKPILAYDAVRPAEIYPFPNSVRDPAFDGQEFPVQVLTGGGNPLDLKPETSTNITFGFVYAQNQSFRASLSAWRTERTEERRVGKVIVITCNRWGDTD